jgi:predicted nuclease of restriction endonuclease-like RecB superfamily
VDKKKPGTKGRKRSHTVSRKLRSKLEDSIAKQLKEKEIPYEYETIRIPYTIPESSHNYRPDFSISTKDGRQILIEGKGIWDNDDRLKHRLILEQHPELDIRFVFSNARSKLRKGSPTSYADICNGLGKGIWKSFKRPFGDKGVIPSEWLAE